MQERFGAELVTGTGLVSGADLHAVPVTLDAPQIHPARRRTVVKKRKPKMRL